MTESEYLETRVNPQITWYSTRATHNKLLNAWAKVLIVLLACSITLITQLDIDTDVKNTILALMGSVIAILTGVSNIFKFHDKWIKYRSAAESLKHEKALFSTGTGGYEGVAEPFKVFVPKIESLIKNENAIWSQILDKSS